MLAIWAIFQSYHRKEPRSYFTTVCKILSHYPLKCFLCRQPTMIPKLAKALENNLHEKYIYGDASNSSWKSVISKLIYFNEKKHFEIQSFFFFQNIYFHKLLENLPYMFIWKVELACLRKGTLFTLAHYEAILDIKINFNQNISGSEFINVSFL